MKDNEKVNLYWIYNIKSKICNGGSYNKHPNYKIIKIYPRVAQVELSSSTNDYNPTSDLDA